MDKKFVNVLLLGFGFMFLFTAFQTMGNIEVNKVLEQMWYLNQTTDENVNRRVSRLKSIVNCLKWSVLGNAIFPIHLPNKKVIDFLLF